jgi:hypothetical protein
MNIIFEPQFLFISQNDWQNDDVRDTFIENLLNHLDFIEKYSIGKFLIPDELYELLWVDPVNPPWRHDVFYKNSLIPVISHKLNKLVELVDLDYLNEEYKLNLKLEDNDLNKLFQKFLLAAAVHEVDIHFLMLGINNHSHNLPLIFTSSKGEKTNINTNIITTLSSWIDKKSLIELIKTKLLNGLDKANEDNLFPNNELARIISPTMTEIRNDSKLNVSMRNSLSLERGRIVALLNGYEYSEKVSNLNKSKNKIRHIYTSGTGTKQVYLSIDVKSFGYEVCSHDGTHIGECNFEGEFTKSADSKGKHSIRIR